MRKSHARIVRQSLIASSLVLALIMVSLTGCSLKKFCGKGKEGETRTKGQDAARATIPMPDYMGKKLEGKALEQHKGEPGVVQTAWETESEQNNFGFNVMRGTSESGNFAPANDKPILGAGNSSTKNAYSFYDKNVKVGDTYFYYIEAIDLSGRTAPFSEKRKVVVTHQYFKQKDTGAPSAK